MDFSFFDAITKVVLMSGAGFLLIFGVIFIRSAFKAALSREAHAASLTCKPEEALRGDYPESTISGKSEALQNGMSYDKREKSLILQGKLSNEYIDDLVG